MGAGSGARAAASLVERRRSGLCALVAASMLALGASAAAPARAQPATDAPSAAAVAEAEARYARATALHEEGNDEAALVEFRRAYELTHEYRVLYNIAQLCYRLRDYVGSVASFEAYLAQGGDDIPAGRKEAVRANIAELAPRIARLTITANVAGAEVGVDGVSRGATPLAGPVLLSEGKHTVSAVLPGRLPVLHVIELAGGEEATSDFTLTEIASAPAIPREHATPDERRWTALSYAGFGLGAALAVGAAVTGGLAVSASNELGKTPYASPPDHDVTSLQTRVRVLSGAADALGGAAILTLGATLFFTLRRAPAPAGASRGGALRIAAWPNLLGASLRAEY